MLKSKGTIYISNTGTVVTPYENGQCKKLENDVSIWNDVYFRRDPVIGFQVVSNIDNDIQSFVTCKNSATYIQGLFPDYNISYMEQIIPKKLSQKFRLNEDIALTDIQSNTINDILKYIKYHEWFVNLQTALGKTLMSVYLSSILNVKSMIMCYSTEILLQWIQTIKEKSNFDTSKLILLDSSKLIQNIYTEKFDSNEYDIFMATPKLIVSYCEKYGYDHLNPVFEKMGIGLKVFDEAHRNISNMIKINGFANVDKTLYLSADFGQANKDKEKLYYKMMFGVPVFKPSDEVMSTLKYTQAIVVEYNTDPNINEVASVYSRFGFSSINYMKYQFNKGIVYDVLDYVLENIFNTNTHNYKTLILLNLIDHVDTLTEVLIEKYGDCKRIGKFHSEINHEEKEETKTISDIIISTYKSFGTGLNVADIKYVISIDQCDKISDNQAAGRARPLSDGSDAFYFMLADRGFKYSGRKLKDRLNYLKMTKIKHITRVRYYPKSKQIF